MAAIYAFVAIGCIAAVMTVAIILSDAGLMAGQ